jgi:hypothetical protein
MKNAARSARAFVWMETKGSQQDLHWNSIGNIPRSGLYCAIANWHLG